MHNTSNERSVGSAGRSLCLTLLAILSRFACFGRLKSVGSIIYVKASSTIFPADLLAWWTQASVVTVALQLVACPWAITPRINSPPFCNTVALQLAVCSWAITPRSNSTPFCNTVARSTAGGVLMGHHSSDKFPSLL